LKNAPAKVKSIAVLLAASAAVASPAMAETLRDALLAAYQSNPNLTAAREGQKAINEGVPLAKANGRPDVVAQPTYFENVLQDGRASVVQARGFNALRRWRYQKRSAGSRKSRRGRLCQFARR
jgi:outer membrane protein